MFSADNNVNKQLTTYISTVGKFTNNDRNFSLLISVHRLEFVPLATRSTIEINSGNIHSIICFSPCYISIWNTYNNNEFKFPMNNIYLYIYITIIFLSEDEVVRVSLFECCENMISTQT